jgi:hypothetical protein
MDNNNDNGANGATTPEVGMGCTYHDGIAHRSYTIIGLTPKGFYMRQDLLRGSLPHARWVPGSGERVRVSLRKDGVYRPAGRRRKWDIVYLGERPGIPGQ